MSLKDVHFILVRPQIGENIGSVARAIKNFNITKLRIVNLRCGWPNQKALVTSVGARDILKSTKIYHSLENAVKKRLLATDRPVACLLSGGLDSSIVTALVSRLYPIL